MALVDLWMSSQDQLRQKHVQQIIAFAGDGKLLDGSEASSEFRDCKRSGGIPPLSSKQLLAFL